MGLQTPTSSRVRHFLYFNHLRLLEKNMIATLTSQFTTPKKTMPRLSQSIPMFLEKVWQDSREEEVTVGITASFARELNVLCTDAEVGDKLQSHDQITLCGYQEDFEFCCGTPGRVVAINTHVSQQEPWVVKIRREKLQG